MATANQGKVLPPISSSMRSAWKACQRKVYYRYVAGIETRSQQSPARAIGKAFHHGVEGWRSDVGSTLALSGATTILVRDMAAMGYDKERIALEAARLDAYLLGYFARWEGDADRPGKWEQEVQLRDGHEIAFIDSVYVDRKGQRWIWEDKTTSQFDEDTATVLPMDEQLLNYALLLIQGGAKVGGAIYRQTLKTRKAPHKKESLEDFRARLIDEYRELGEGGVPNNHYREIVVTFDVTNLNEYANEKLDVDAEIAYSLKGKHNLAAFRRNTHQCIGKFGACDYLALCSKRADVGAVSFKPNGKEPLDGGEFKRKIWGEAFSDGGGTPTPTTPPGYDECDAWAYE